MATKKKNKRWIQKATKSIAARGTAGKCTPITKPGCTGRAKALALTFKKIARNRKKEDGGFLMDEFDNLPEMSMGGILADVAQGAGTGALGGAAFGGIGAVPGALIGGATGLIKGLVSNNQEKQESQLLADQEQQKATEAMIQSRMMNLQPQHSYMPVAAKGGFISYKGQSHDGDQGGIPVDQQGNPTFVTNSEPVALTEDGEVTWFSPNEGAYVFSDKLGFAKPAQKLVDKYKLDEKNIDDPYMQTAVDKQFENLKISQENKKMQSKKRKTVPIKQDGGDLTKLYNGGYEDVFDPNNIPGMRYYSWGQNYTAPVNLGMGNSNVMPNTVVPSQTSSYMPSLMGYNPQNLTAANYTNLSPSSSRFGQQYLGPERSYADWQNEVGTGKGYTALNSAGERVGLQDNPELLAGATDAMPGRIHESIAPARIEGARGGQVKDIYSMAIDSSGRLNPLYDNAEPSTALHPVRDQQKYADAMPNTSDNGEDYNPMLSPLAHGLSAVGSIADYYAMKKAKPEELSLPRVGAERVSYARQRLANRQRANEAKALGTRTARNMGLSGATAAANIGATGLNVNQQLGQQNTLSYENEANKNAMLRQQAGMTNAQIAMQEGLYNNRLQNAYRAQMAQMNPFGQLARTGAGYFKDNAAYQRGWDTLQMLSPNAEISQEPGTNWLDKFLRETRSVNFRGEPLKYTTK